MSKIDSPSRNSAVPAELPPRPKHGHHPPEVDPAPRDLDVVDPHPKWLKKWRSLRAGPGGCRVSEGSAELVVELQNKIAQTPARTLAGLQAQAELISELAWNDVVAATARRLIAGLRQLRRLETG